MIAPLVLQILITVNEMDLLNKNGYSLRNLDKVNVILGKNGSGKSTALINNPAASRGVLEEPKLVV